MPRHGLLPFVVAALLAACTPLDRHPVDNAFEDERLEGQAIAHINERHNGIVHVNVTSFNRHLLLTGEVPSETAKVEIARTAAEVSGVRRVSNELVVGPNTGITSRTKDSLISSDIKMRFANYGKFHAGYIKVITENRTAYLLGRVYRREAAAAADLASTTGGVGKVILMFEYLD